MERLYHKMVVITLIYLLALYTPVDGSAAAFHANEMALRTDMLNSSTYSNKIRPDEKVNISVRFNVLTLNELNTRTQSLELTGWLTAKWEDTRLTWTPSNYGGIQYMFETEDVIWRPMLFVDNSIGSMNMITDDDLLIRAKYTGEITWEPPAIYNTHCEIITTYYPFDTQECFIELVSWAYTIDEVMLKHMSSSINLEDYRVNGEWELVSTHLETNTLIDGDETFSQLEFILRLRRLPMFYVLNIIFPVMMTSFLSLLIFLLPHDSGEKVSYSLTVLLAYAVLLTLISDNMPSTSHHVSVLSVYLSMILFVGAFSVLLAVVSLYLFHQPAEKPIPAWIKSFILGFMLKLTSYDLRTERGGRSGTAQGRSPSREKVYPSGMAAHRKSISSEKLQSVNDDNISNTDKPNVQGQAWSDDNAYAYERYSWIDLAKIFDAFFYRLYLILVMGITLICLIILAIGGYVSWLSEKWPTLPNFTHVTTNIDT